MEFQAAYEKDKEIILLTEFLEGGELFERISDENHNLTEVESVDYMQQLLQGLEYLHNAVNVIHLDLKPENIVFINKVDSQIKIIDFGLARFYTPDIRVMAGTPEFLSPEVINFDPVDYKSDMWSVGVITYVLLSGLSPFMGDTDSETSSNITGVLYDFDTEVGNLKNKIKSILLIFPDNKDLRSLSRAIKLSLKCFFFYASLKIKTAISRFNYFAGI